MGSGEGWNWSNYGSSGCVSSGPGSCNLNNAGNLHIENSSAMTGGKGATTQSVFSTSDATAATQQQQTVDTNLTKKAKKQLKRLAAQDKSVIAQTSGGTGVVVTVNNPTLPTGCNTSASTPCPAASTETLTVTLTAAATAYSPTAAKAAILKDLKSKSSNGELLADPDLGNPRVVSAGAGGTVTLTSHAVGYWAPQLNLKTFQGKLSFMHPGAAKTYLLGHLPGSSTVTISQSPFGLPWLPLFSGNIHLVRVSLAQGRTSG